MADADELEEDVSAGRGCGTMAVHERLLRADADYGRARESHHREVAGAGTLADVTLIPVVVHVVWKHDEQNIDMAQVESQIAVLNRDFRKTNSDIGSIPAPFAPLAADARIEFELASVDPAGDPTDGVSRTQTDTDLFTIDNKIKSAAAGGADGWPPDRYLNVWVGELGTPSGFLLISYAQFPGGPAETDGVVVKHSAFGTTGTAAPPHHLGRSATHEIGHWLNLFHIWGRTGGCNSTDFVADTPVADQPNSGKPTFPHVSCNNGPNGDMFMNYMDVVADEAMFMFTRGQVERMQACLENDRPTIGRQAPSA